MFWKMSATLMGAPFSGRSAFGVWRSGGCRGTSRTPKSERRTPRRVELSRHRMMVCCGVAAADGMRELALDIREQAAGADTEQVWMQPGVAQLLLHERQPVERLPGRSNAAGRLEADAAARALVVIANGARH